jgi:glycosyltransferase involved in cell wall biosynthesis
MLLSICIPTYNRPVQLKNCINSLALQINKNFEVCISDNSSNYDIKKLIEPFKKKLKIQLNINRKNLGFAQNVIQATSMAKNEFIWLLGDDDLLIKTAVDNLTKIIKKNFECDFFWINSYYYDYINLEKFSHPFDPKFLPKNLKKHSLQNRDKKLNFFDLIDYRISFDYLLGIYLCVFRNSKWKKNLIHVDKKKISDIRTWSNFDNTCFHIKVFCKAFKDSKVYLCAKPLSVNLYGVREWNKLYSFIEIVRIPEVLDYYRDNGMKFLPYIVNKNYSLRNFFNYFIKIILGGKEYGLNYVDFKKNFICNLIYPNSWFSILYYAKRTLINFFKNITKL